MWLAFALLPLAVYLALLVPGWRITPWLDTHARGSQERAERKRGIWTAVAAGALIAIPAELAVRALASWSGVDPKAPVTGALSSMLIMLFVFAPLEEASKVAALWPFRSRHLHAAEDGVVLGSAVAMGFASVEAAVYLKGAALVGYDGALLVVRAMLATVARLFAGALWGYALAHAQSFGRRIDRFFALAWIAATAIRGLYDHLIFGRGLASLLGAMPLFFGMLAAGYLGARELTPNALPLWRIRKLPFLPSLPPPPSLRAMRDALRRAERPVMLRWIALGAVVTMGVIITSVVGSVVLARRFGVDFSAVDEGEISGIVPLVLLGLGVLLAFPASGYLVARASGADSVLEVAFSTALSIVGMLIMLGLAAPVAVVFALAFAPIAFALACAGAWVGIGAPG